MFYGNAFFVFSILGFGYEKITSLLMCQPKETLLIGPWMPIYGIGFLIVHFIHERLKKEGLQGFKKILWCFFLSIVALTVLEEIGGLLTNFLFAKSFWSYEGIPLSIGPYINVFISCLWGFFAIILEFIVFPKLTKVIKRIPKWLTYLMIFLFVFDNIIALKNNLVWFM